PTPRDTQQEEHPANQRVQRRPQYPCDEGIEPSHEPIEVHRHGEACHVAPRLTSRRRLVRRAEAGCIRCFARCVVKATAPRTVEADDTSVGSGLPENGGNATRRNTKQYRSDDVQLTKRWGGRRVIMTHRGIILGSLLALAVPAPGHALVKKVPIAPGSNQ